MTHSTGNQKFYEGVDEMCKGLHDAGKRHEAERIEYLLHQVAWTSTSELFNALEVAFEEIIANDSANELSPEAKSELCKYLQLLNDVR